MKNSKNIKKLNPRYGSSLEHGDAHQKEHISWSRRSFLRNMGLAGGASLLLGKLPVFAAGSSALNFALSNSVSDRILVLIRLKGGNDGLNTFIPLFDYDTYVNLRPTLRIQESNITNLTGDFGMPNNMDALLPMWEEEKMKVVQNVGYPGQNLSHFRSTDVWTSASDVDVVEGSGWLGRFLDNQYPDFLTNPPEKPPSIQIGSIGNSLFDNQSGVSLSVSITDPEQLFDIAQNGQLYDTENLPECYYGEQVGFVRAIANTTFIYAQEIKDAYDASTNAVEYAPGLGRQLSLVARMIKGNLGTKLYMVTLDGFDTHAEQKNAQLQLLENVANAVKNFYDDLATTGHDTDVLAMTFSEFGRRIAQNASAGTDHGAAAPMMFFGEGLNGNGFIGDNPDMQNPDNNGNLIFSTDFREVYATVLENWLCIDSELVDEVLLGETFERIDLGLTCNPTSVFEPSAPPTINHKAIYASNGKIFIEYTLPALMRINIQIFNILGQPIATLYNGVQLSGKHQVAFEDTNAKLVSGQYYYRILANGNAYSNPIRFIRM